jgi:Zn-finger nucleic acid-binding protein
MTCPSCGAPMQLKPSMDNFKCEYCQSVYFPDKNDDGVRVLADQTDESIQNCPVCSNPLKLAAIDRFRILYCSTCHGMLIPMGEFQALIDDPAQGFINWTNPASLSNRDSPDLLDAIASLFRS